jgi:glutathione synthase
MAQKYLPDIVVGGDSRVLLIDGEPVPYALSRIPDAADNRGNLAAGATGVGRPLNERDRWLCQQIGPALREAGVLFAGLDVIGGYVTEINVTSPTGVRELERQFNLDIAGSADGAIERRLSTRSR